MRDFSLQVLDDDRSMIGGGGCLLSFRKRSRPSPSLPLAVADAEPTAPCGVQCVSEGDAPAGGAAGRSGTRLESLQDDEEESLSVSALGRQVDAMGERFASWSSTKGRRKHGRGPLRGQGKLVGRVVSANGGVRFRQERSQPCGFGSEPELSDESDEESSEDEACGSFWGCCTDGGSDRPPVPRRRATLMPEAEPPASLRAAAPLAEEAEPPTALAGSDQWVVEQARGRGALHATVTRAELCQALYGGGGAGEGDSGHGPPRWLRQALAVRPFFLWQLDLF